MFDYISTPDGLEPSYKSRHERRRFDVAAEIEMRAFAVVVLATFTLAFANPGLAQDGAGGQGATDNSKPALGSGRVNSLSPDEARRAERSRARAAKKAPTPETAKPTEAEKTTVRREEKAAPPVREARRPQRARPTERIAEQPRSPRIAKRHAPRRFAQEPEREPTRAVEPDRRRSRYAEHKPRYRGRYAREWTPRVGRVVPPYVRLYRLPPGYYYPPAYAAPVYAAPAYARPAWNGPFFMPQYPSYPTTEVEEVD